jgi:photosystem II stability/assembly factor-like uncharacterized protein
MKRTTKLGIVLALFGLLGWMTVFVTGWSPTFFDAEFSATDEPEKRRKDEEGRYDEPEKFFEFHRAIRTPDDRDRPEYVAGHKLFAYRQVPHIKHGPYQALPNARTKSGNGVLEWRERGPANVPGRTRAMIVLPNDATNRSWLAGSATGGIWKTTDAGLSWTEKSANFPVLPISSFAHSQGVIYAGTGEFESSIFSAVGDGVFKSTDFGETWTHLASTRGNPEFSIVTRLIVDPNNSNVIVVTAAPSDLDPDNTSAILRSTDGGSTWTKVFEVTGALEQIVFTPGNFLIQYATQRGVGVIKSTDGGQSWALSNQGMSPVGRVEVAVAPTDPNRIYASCVGPTIPSGTGGLRPGADLYVSSDAGTTWALVDVNFNGRVFDFLGGQGNYDNTISVDPFNRDAVYYGGVNYFRTQLGSGTTKLDNYEFVETNTQVFLSLIAFNNAGFFASGRLQVGSESNRRSVEIRFGPGISQRAHRFLVPEGSTSGVPTAGYTYQDYVNVPLQAWDITNPTAPKQLMVSFRDQSRNGALDFLAQNFDVAQPLQNSREYVYIHSVDYNETTPIFTAGSTGGQETQLAYAFFPGLTPGGTWTPTNLPVSVLTIKYSSVDKLVATTVTCADAYNGFDGKNRFNQVNMESGGVHPDHHFTTIIPIDQNAKTFQVMIGTDGGVFLSNTSTTPGIAEGDWSFRGRTYNTSQFYGADKRPGKDEYFGGMQDNGTRRSPVGQSASKTSNYVFCVGGDGFEVVWHPTDENRLIGSLYYNTFYRSTDGGTTWATAFSGFGLSGGSPDPARYPFVSKLANSRNTPDVLFAVGADGVWKSENFGGNWTLSPITTNWGTLTTLFDVDVSRANANIIWAGSGMNATRRLHVSTNGGATFTATNNFTQVPLGVITKLATHPTQMNTAYALFSFFKRPKILRTTDLGQSWQDISGFGNGSASTTGFPDVAVYCLYVRPDNPNIIWVGTEIGIVESRDNGQNWALLDDFPNVSVWDMKGVDDQVVIATFGRGIWTAKIDQPQVVSNNPVVAQVGTSPRGRFMIQLQLPDAYDSTQVFISNTRIGRLGALGSGTYNVSISNQAPGLKEVRVVGFKNRAPFTSPVFRGEHILVTTPQRQYYSFFNAANDFSLQGFTVQSLGDNSTLQSEHSYLTLKDYQARLRTPIIINATGANFSYRDVALVEPGLPSAVFGQPEFKDFVIVEGTKDGLTWTPLANGYDANQHADWLNTYRNLAPGNLSLKKDQNVDLRQRFQTNDTVLFRFRLFSDANGVGWGWSIDDLFIQIPPVGLETSWKSDVQVYPNPVRDQLYVRYSLPAPSSVQLKLLTSNGRTVRTMDGGDKNQGAQEDAMGVADITPGIYLIRIETRFGQATQKVVIRP